MNYGGKGIKQKKKLLNSAATRLRTKLGVFAIKFILILAIAVVVSGSCLVLGSVQGIISSAISQKHRCTHWEARCDTFY